MDYTTLCSLKPRLRLAEQDTAADAALKSLIRSVCEWIDGHCGRKFGRDEYTHFLKGNGTQLLALPQRPVHEIVSLYFDDTAYWGDAPGAFGADKLLVEGVDYALGRDQPDGSSLSGLVYRINDVWRVPQGRGGTGFGRPTLANVPQARVGNVKVVYVAGDVPAAVKLAAETAVARLWQTGKYGAAVQGESTPKYSYTLAAMSPDDLLGPAKGLLATVKEFVF
jgi:hypothetical protein